MHSVLSYPTVGASSAPFSSGESHTHTSSAQLSSAQLSSAALINSSTRETAELERSRDVTLRVMQVMLLHNAE
jgi:hypothetical protein